MAAAARSFQMMKLVSIHFKVFIELPYLMAYKIHQAVGHIIIAAGNKKDSRILTKYDFG